jgi:hypothetical protein
MMTNQWLRWRAGWTMNLVACLCMTLISWLGHGVHGGTAKSQLAITVHEGQLSVDLQDADVGDVHAAIGRQASLTILGHPRPATRVSAQFTGMPLADGLRRLLRLASLSSTMVYAHAPSGATVLTAVHVFEEATGPAPPPQLAADHSAEDRPEEAGHSFVEALAQLSTASPPPPQTGEHDGEEHFRALLESAQHYAASPGTGKDNELARRFREALEQPGQPPDDTSPPDLPQMEYQE